MPTLFSTWHRDTTGKRLIVWRRNQAIYQHLPRNHISRHHHSSKLRTSRRSFAIDGSRTRHVLPYLQDRSRSHFVNNILGQLEFHTLSITLLAMVAHQSGSNATPIWFERNITRALGPPSNSHLPHVQTTWPSRLDLLGVIAFFRQGINEDNFDWLFPMISNVPTTPNELCILSRSYRSDGCIAMLVLLRDYLCLKGPLPSPLLRTAKESYFTRLSAKRDPAAPGSRETE